MEVAALNAHLLKWHSSMDESRQCLAKTFDTVNGDDLESTPERMYSLENDKETGMVQDMKQDQIGDDYKDSADDDSNFTDSEDDFDELDLDEEQT